MCFTKWHRKRIVNVTTFRSTESLYIYMEHCAVTMSLKIDSVTYLKILCLFSNEIVLLGKHFVRQLDSNHLIFWEGMVAMDFFWKKKLCRQAVICFTISFYSFICKFEEKLHRFRLVAKKYSLWRESKFHSPVPQWLHLIKCCGFSSQASIDNLYLKHIVTSWIKSICIYSYYTCI